MTKNKLSVLKRVTALLVLTVMAVISCNIPSFAAAQIYISKIELSSNLSEIAVAGKNIRTPQLTVTNDVPVDVFASWVDSSNSVISGGTFKKGSYRLRLSISVTDNNYYMSQPSVYIDGQSWGYGSWISDDLTRVYR